jgi:uncharacterized protein
MRASRYNLILPLNDQDDYAAFNTLSGAIAVVDREMADLLNDLDSGETAIPDEDSLAELRSVGFLVDDETDELRIFDVQYNTRKYNVQELWFTLMMTYACNLACTYCYQGAGDLLPPERITDEKAGAVVTFIKGYTLQSGCRDLAVLLCGGEPLLNFRVGLRIIDEIYSWTRTTGISFGTGLVTNGTLFDRHVAQQMARYPQRVSQITLDGPRHVHDSRRGYRSGRGSYDDIVRALGVCLEFGIDNVLLRIDVDKDNVGEMQGLFDDLKGRGLGRIPLAFGPIQPKTDTCRSYSHRCIGGEEARKLIVPLWESAIEQGFHVPLKPHPMFVYCGAQSNFSFMIDPKLHLYKCSNYIGRPEFRIASIGTDGSLTDLRFEYFNWMSRSPLAMEACRQCKVLPLCGGGCAGMAHTERGTIHREYCGDVKYLIENQVRLHLKQTLRGPSW